MRRYWKWSAIALGGLAALVLAAVAYVYAASEQVISHRYPLRASRVHASADPKVIALGQHLVRPYGCADCHRPNLMSRLSAIALGLVLAACNQHWENRHQALAACEAEGMRIHAHLQSAEDQYRRMGDYALLCMKAKNYDWHSESKRCRQEEPYTAMADEECYSLHGGD